ncbi:unnamed protein product [Sphenostylis stenocarpa]|uniref:WRKY domain-containing protein n=1 Tax=Sphenostylis stenocarpa TaxID=92480 RepID=A0AA86S8A8_9FABA|nr:unnamed protein product [Sphenostylis stenocarpa]
METLHRHKALSHRKKQPSVMPLMDSPLVQPLRTITTTTTCKKCKKGINGSKTGVGGRIAFRTKSELEIMDDGYKWRKYGKKSVKSSPNLRNYYKCSSGGCIVKKRVERDREDSSYVITTYEGVHNHESPFSTYYSPISFLHSDDFTSTK